MEETETGAEITRLMAGIKNVLTTSYTHRAINRGNLLVFVHVSEIKTRDGHRHVFVWEDGE